MYGQGAPATSGSDPVESTRGCLMSSSIAIRRSGGGRSSGIAVATRGPGRRLVEATALSLLAQTALPVAAQDELEQVVVTGSRIARPDFSSASPIVSVTEELFQRSGSRTVEATLNTLPQFVPAYTGTSNNPANGGQANISLRGLGPTSTLVLLDGRRLIPANGDGVPDLNIIPSALIESVEIITGGASAVYGSDALAGVVNFKLRREFDGFEVEGSWGQTDRGDGRNGFRWRPRIRRRLRGVRRSRARDLYRSRVLEIRPGVSGPVRRRV